MSNRSQINSASLIEAVSCVDDAKAQLTAVATRLSIAAPVKVSASRATMEAQVFFGTDLLIHVPAEVEDVVAYVVAEVVLSQNLKTVPQSQEPADSSLIDLAWLKTLVAGFCRTYSMYRIRHIVDISTVDDTLYSVHLSSPTGTAALDIPRTEQKRVVTGALKDFFVDFCISSSGDFLAEARRIISRSGVGKITNISTNKPFCVYVNFGPAPVPKLIYDTVTLQDEIRQRVFEIANEAWEAFQVAVVEYGSSDAHVQREGDDTARVLLGTRSAVCSLVQPVDAIRECIKKFFEECFAAGSTDKGTVSQDWLVARLGYLQSRYEKYGIQYLISVTSHRPQHDLAYTVILCTQSKRQVTIDIPFTMSMTTASEVLQEFFVDFCVTSWGGAFVDIRDELKKTGLGKITDVSREGFPYVIVTWLDTSQTTGAATLKDAKHAVESKISNGICLDVKWQIFCNTVAEAGGKAVKVRRQGSDAYIVHGAADTQFDLRIHCDMLVAAVRQFFTPGDDEELSPEYVKEFLKNESTSDIMKKFDPNWQVFCDAVAGALQKRVNIVTRKRGSNGYSAFIVHTLTGEETEFDISRPPSVIDNDVKAHFQDKYHDDRR